MDTMGPNDKGLDLSNLRGDRLLDGTSVIKFTNEGGLYVTEEGEEDNKILDLIERIAHAEGWDDFVQSVVFMLSENRYFAENMQMQALIGGKKRFIEESEFFCARRAEKRLERLAIEILGIDEAGVERSRTQVRASLSKLLAQPLLNIFANRGQPESAVDGDTETNIRKLKIEKNLETSFGAITGPENLVAIKGQMPETKGVRDMIVEVLGQYTKIYSRCIALSIKSIVPLCDKYQLIKPVYDTNEEEIEIVADPANRNNEPTPEVETDIETDLSSLPSLEELEENLRGDEGE